MNTFSPFPRTIRVALAGAIVLAACQKQQPSDCVEDGQGCDNGQICCSGVRTETTSSGRTTCTCGGSAGPPTTSGPDCSANKVSLTAQPTAIRGTSSVVVTVEPTSGDCKKVPDGTVVELALLDDDHTGSTLSENSVTTLESKATVTLNAGSTPGIIVITAELKTSWA
jgi:hypothetical protein